ncbi:MAG: hypothetical protein HRT68_11995, partial [Flavobacteriaceae bacterium]|nr:hypothetical protein [Flavobacteriaceae bacterium]
MKTYSIFGAGAAGLYTAWRLLKGEAKNKKETDKLLKEGDILELYDWGKYDFSKKDPGTREPGARVCTWHYKNDKDNSYLELGGMRYSYWDGTPKGEGHRLVTKTISDLGIDKYSVPFNESSDPLLSLRSKNMYLSDITSKNAAPYFSNNYMSDVPPDEGFTKLELVAIDEKKTMTRRDWCELYNHGKIKVDMGDDSVFKKGDLLKNIGYWNLGYDV